MAILQAPRIWVIRGIPLVKMQRLRLRSVRVDMKGCWVSKDVILTKKTRLYYRSAIQDKHENIENIIMIWLLISKKWLSEYMYQCAQTSTTQQIITNSFFSSVIDSHPCSCSKSPKSLAWNFFRELLSAITKVSWKRWDKKVHSVDDKLFWFLLNIHHTHPRKN